MNINLKVYLDIFMMSIVNEIIQCSLYLTKGTKLGMQIMVCKREWLLPALLENNQQG